MRQTLCAIAISTLAALATLPAASAGGAGDDIRDILVCRNPGPQGTIITVPYFVWVDGTGWVGPYYYVYGSTSYQNVDRYNHCVAGFQVGAVWVSYGGSRSWASCVNCPWISTDTLP